MQAHERVIFIAVLMALFISIYIVGESLTRFLWRKYHTISIPEYASSVSTVAGCSVLDLVSGRLGR